MAKGDAIHVVTRGGSDFRDGVMASGVVHTMRASKAGRTVRWKTITRGKEQWAVVEEQTRFGRPTGNRLMVRMSEVVSIEEQVVDLPEPKKKPVKVTIAEPGLWDAGEMGAITIGARAG